jgi:hypothetical protein
MATLKKNLKVKPTVDQLLIIQTNIVEQRTAALACAVVKISFRDFKRMMKYGAEIKEQQLLKLLRYAQNN